MRHRRVRTTATATATADSDLYSLNVEPMGRDGDVLADGVLSFPPESCPVMPVGSQLTAEPIGIMGHHVDPHTVLVTGVVLRIRSWRPASSPVDGFWHRFLTRWRERS